MTFGRLAYFALFLATCFRPAEVCGAWKSNDVETDVDRKTGAIFEVGNGRDDILGNPGCDVTASCQRTPLAFFNWSTSLESSLTTSWS